MKAAMDVIQFGKWLSEKRKKNGWPSQRALVEAVRQDPMLSEWRISEDFLARLEAGRLAHPFRNSVRKQVLALAWFLCKSPREVQTYLHAASMNDLSGDEEELVRRIREDLSPRSQAAPRLLPPRPARVFGRERQVHELVQQLCSIDVGLCAITGMPGIGKSTLVAEAVHVLIAHEHMRPFHDGIVTLSCTGRSGVAGLLELLHEIIVIFSQGQETLGMAKSVASAIDHVRMLLAQKNVLIILDNVEAQFPLRQALDALLGNINTQQHGRRVVLSSSRFIPAPALVRYHCHVDVLEPDDALTLLSSLLPSAAYAPSAFVPEEQVYAERICAAVGYHPLAIELAANALTVEGIPLSLLAANCEMNPLTTVLDSDEVLITALEQAFQTFHPAQQDLYALLALPGPYAFSLECATALRAQNGKIPVKERVVVGSDIKNRTVGHRVEDERVGKAYDAVVSMMELTTTAMELGRFVSSSLLERSTSCGEMGEDLYNARYHLHPLLLAYAQQRLQSMDVERVTQGTHQLLTYVEAYLERHQGDTVLLEREQEALLHALEQAWNLKQYGFVMQFVAKLLRLSGRFKSFEDAERVLRWGIQASQHVEDTHYHSVFIARLGLLYCAHGLTDIARTYWEESLRLAEDSGYPAYLWMPTLYIAHLHHLQGDTETALTLADAFWQRTQAAGDLRSLATASLRRGCYARILGDNDTAHDQVSFALSLLFMLSTEEKTPERILELEARTELARIQGDYVGSSEYAEAAFALMMSIGDPYVAALHLLEQARFATKVGMYYDASTLSQRALAAAPHAIHLANCRS